MNITIIGAGAIGGYIAARLAEHGQSVNMIARGETLAQLQQHGIGLQEGDGEVRYFPVNAVADASELPVQDLVIVAVKEPALQSILPHLQALKNPDTLLMTAMNGIPWWFTAGIDGARDVRLNSLDPDGQLTELISLYHVIGCVLHMACSSPSVGIVRHNMGDRMIIGPATRQPLPATDTIAELLRRIGFQVETTDYVQRDIWFKLWGNMTHNPISALTLATTDQIVNDPYTSQLAVRIMQEAQQVGRRIGCAVDQDPVQRNLETLKLGAFKTSMLQDLEAGRPLEINALLGAFCDLAHKLDEPVPYAESLFGLIRLLDRNR
ncbi:2-dehydropantoate 2-reductase [Oceanobacter mangrovi]|uniref:2-dehydropantoate 2-reductase n=1 Tax=Oceanobacter mangrovi TaxID=2862510 RepID=UPI001C8E9261|nr:2-dehydropantoate 2-reductase [Oceanobacter mangrovi]